MAEKSNKKSVEQMSMFDKQETATDIGASSSAKTVKKVTTKGNTTNSVNNSSTKKNININTATQQQGTTQGAKKTVVVKKVVKKVAASGGAVEADKAKTSLEGTQGAIDAENPTGKTGKTVKKVVVVKKVVASSASVDKQQSIVDGAQSEQTQPQKKKTSVKEQPAEEKISSQEIADGEKAVIESVAAEDKTEDVKSEDNKADKVLEDKASQDKASLAQDDQVDEKNHEAEGETVLTKVDKKAEKAAKKAEEKRKAKELKEKAKKYNSTEFVHFESTAEEGLNDTQIEERQLRGLTNYQDNSISKSYLKIFTSNIFTLFNLVNIFLVCLIIIFNGQLKNMLFAGIALVNLVIGIFQEIRSKRALDKLSLVSAPSIDVVRNGQIVSISTDQIVIDDVIILKQGSQIPTDCIVVGGECEANESLLTGEQDDIHKGLGDRLMSGSFVQAGTCKARVIAVGEDTYASKLMSEAKKFKKSKSELMRSINWIIRIATVIIFPLGIMMFFTNRKYSPSISGAVTSTVSSVIGMIPEGLVMLTSIALALGIIRLAKKRTLVQDLYSIEALARVDVLCLDKTGTITEGTMQVENVHVYSSMCGSADDIMANMVKALGANNATFEACAEYFSSNETFKVTKLMPFSSARKWSGASFDGVGTFIVGAPEFVLKERYDTVERNVNEYAMQGFRVLQLC